MRSYSRPIDSGQSGVHRQLQRVLATHLCSEYKKPIAEYCHELFEQLEALRRNINKPLILDSGCGTASATRILAQQNPDALVIGVDKSAHRLALGGVSKLIQQQDNYLLLRMDLVDFWRLALRHGWKLKKHYLLYPNPWPKPKHLRRRWHGHPVFPQLLGLGGVLELRCNWWIYALEFQTALNYIMDGACKMNEYDNAGVVSLFEQKYRASGHKLFQCLCDLDNLKINKLENADFRSISNSKYTPEHIS